MVFSIFCHFICIIIISLGGDTLTITGTGFGNTEMPVTLGGVSLVVSSYTDTEIVATLPALPDGAYSVLVDVQNMGYADLRFVKKMFFSL